MDITYLSDYLSSYIAQSMNSDYFLEQMGIDSLSQLKPGSEKFQEWVINIKKSSDLNTIRLAKPLVSDLKDTIQAHVPGNATNESNIEPSLPPMFGLPDDLGSGSFFKLRIIVHSKVIYNDEDVHDKNAIGYMDEFAKKQLTGFPAKQLLDFFDQQSTADIKDSDGNVIASVSTRVSQGYIMVLGLIFTFGVILAGILALLASLIISKILTIPIVIPLTKLDEKISAIASDSGEAAMTAHIVLKKPLREIESLANSTNSIIEKTKEYNELLMAQNEELEAQNIELTNSKTQIEEAQNLLIQTENMASIGQLTAAITHEINTPLGAISSNAQMSSMLLDSIFQLDTVKGNNKLLELLTQLQEANNISTMACYRVNQIIRSLKNFSKVDQAEFQEADINEGLKSVLVLTSNLWKRKIVMHETYGEVPRIRCYSGMLNQVFMNLVVNAIQAIEDKGDIFITTSNDEENLYVSIKDNGCGINEENIPKIFDSGYTTKSSTLGMGLGLSISRSIITKHGGDIKVTSKPGEGTTFTISLPLTPNS